MTVVKNPGRELFKMYVPDIKAFFEVRVFRSLGPTALMAKLTFRG